ncbi:MAG: TonB-dependent receptor domain-containing protein, partial [Myxococcota bacterium]
GRVVDASTGEGMIEGQVTVVGEGRRVITDIDGHFDIDLPPGTYTLRSFYEFYEPGRVQGIEVKPGQRTEVTIRLQPESEESFTEEVQVTARADKGTEATQLQMRRESAQVRDSVSAEEIDRSPDSSAGDATRRIVAATIVGGRYLYVRGLGGRYTNALLDGAPVPGVDPDNPAIQLDLFPASSLSSLAILKGATPDLPANFAGGTLQLSTREAPTDFTMGASLSLGANTETTFQGLPSYQGGKLDWLGIDDGTRSLPDGVPNRRVTVGGDAPLTDEDVRRIAGGFSNIWAVENPTAPPAMSARLDLGDTIDVGDKALGYTLSLGYGRKLQRTRETQRRVVTTSAPGVTPLDVEIRDDFEVDTGTVSTQLSLLGSSNLALSDDDDLTVTTMLVHAADEFAGVLEGISENRNNTILRSQRLQWVERTLWFNRLGGTHDDFIGEADLRWYVTGSLSRRDEPDTRDFSNMRLRPDRPDEPFVFTGQTGSDAQRLFLNLVQAEGSGGADLDVPTRIGTFKLGGMVSATKRDFQMRRFTYRRLSSDRDVVSLPPEELLSPTTVGEWVDFREFTRAQDSYTGAQQLYAGYAMIDSEPLEWFRFAGGLRTEAFRQRVEADSPFADDEEPPFSISRTDVRPLPSATTRFTVGEDMYLRAGYGMTVARPQLREIAPIQYPDFIRQRLFDGTPDLRDTQIHNMDVRWELFPSETDVIAVSAFAKMFDDPIELVILSDNNILAYQNVDSARNLGAELEVRMGLERVSRALRHLSVGGNFTYVDSRVGLTEDQAARATSKNRPLAGQSPWVANLTLGFRHPDAAIDASVYYNVFGRRLEEVGFAPVPDTYREPFHSLDLVFQWGITDHWALKGIARNLLFQDVDLRQGGVAVRRYRPGMDASIQIKWTN